MDGDREIESLFKEKLRKFRRHLRY